MPLTFKTHEERMAHPLGKLIPEEYWHVSFKRVLSDEQIELMNLCAGELQNCISALRSKTLSDEDKIAVFYAIANSHPKLDYSDFKNILTEIHFPNSDYLSHFCTLANIDYLNAYAKDSQSEFLSSFQQNKNTLYTQSARAGHLEVLEYLESIAPDQVQNMISEFEYFVYSEVARNGHVSVMRHIESLVTSLPLLTIIMAYRNAVFNKHLIVLQHLESLTPNLIETIIAKNQFQFFWFVMDQAKSGDTSLSDHFFTQNLASCFELAESKGEQYNEVLNSVMQSALKQYHQHECINLAGNFDLTNLNDIKSCFYFLRRLIRQNKKENNYEIYFLLSIPAIQDFVSKLNEPNELIRLVLENGNADVLEMMLDIPILKNLIEKNNYYQETILNRDIQQTKKTPTVDDIVVRMQRLGYPSNPSGVCLGVGGMGAQAILARDMPSFENRFNIMMDILPQETFLYYRNLKQERIDVIQQVKKDQNFPRQQDIETALAARISPYKQKQMEMIPFFEGMELYQNKALYYFLFEDKNRNTDFISTSELISPVVLDQKNTNEPAIKSLDPFAGIYQSDENIFENLEQILNANQIDFPVAFLLYSPIHVCTAGYDPKTKKWVLINAGTPIQYFDHSKALFQAVMDAHDAKGCVALATHILTTPENVDALNQCVNEWKNTESFKNAHTITPHKATLLDSRAGSWMTLAAMIGDNDKVKEIVEELDRDNDAVILLFSLILASQYNHIEVVNTLIASGKINVNFSLKIYENEFFPLLTAVVNNQETIITTLVKAGAVLNDDGLKRKLASLLLDAVKIDDIENVYSFLLSGVFNTEYELTVDKFNYEIRKLPEGSKKIANDIISAQHPDNKLSTIQLTPLQLAMIYALMLMILFKRTLHNRIQDFIILLSFTLS